MTRKIVNLALFSAIAIVLHSFEALLPLPLPLGIKFGFANIISLVVIELYGAKEMFIVNMLRVFLSGLLVGNIMSYPFFMSLAGVSLSSLVLTLLKHTDLSLPTRSILSAVGHNCGQLMVLSLVVNNQAVMFYLVIMLISSIPTGLLTALCAREIIKRLDKSYFREL